MRDNVAVAAKALVIHGLVVHADVDGGLFTEDAWKPADCEDPLRDFKLSK